MQTIAITREEIMRSRLMLFGCASVLALTGVAMAQAELETVVVTAAKGGAQKLLESPMSVQVLSDVELKAKHISDIHDLRSASSFATMRCAAPAPAAASAIR
jgi:outer membrane receptor for ferrienterochelin and colicin